VGVVDEAVEDGVGDGGVGDRLVPVIDRQLAGHDGRAAIVPIVDDLQQIATLLLRQRGEPPVVEDQKLDACQGLECVSAWNKGSDSISMKFADGIALFTKRNQPHANQFSDFCSRPRGSGCRKRGPI